MTKELDWERFTMLMRTISEATKGSALSIEALGLYYKMLQRYDFEVISQAVFNLIQTSKFMPAISEIIQQIEGTPEERSSIAWSKVLKAISDVGTYKSVVFDDPFTHYAIARMGGWMQMGKIEEDQLRFVARDFERYYQEAVRLRLSWGSPEIPKALLGVIDAHAVRNGYELSEPVKPGELKAPAIFPQIEPPKPEGKLIPVNIDFSKIGKKI